MKKGKGELRFDPTLEPSMSVVTKDIENEDFNAQSSPRSPPGFGRRRSKSQGHLLPGRSLYEYDPFELDLSMQDDSLLEGDHHSQRSQEELANAGDRLWKDGLLGDLNDVDVDARLDKLRKDQGIEPVLTRRWASSFHTFENDLGGLGEFDSLDATQPRARATTHFKSLESVPLLDSNPRASGNLSSHSISKEKLLHFDNFLNTTET